MDTSLINDTNHSSYMTYAIYITFLLDDMTSIQNSCTLEAFCFQHTRVDSQCLAISHPTKMNTIILFYYCDT